MKKNISLLILLFIALQGNSQGLNTELGFNDEYYQYVQEVACDGIYTYLVIHKGHTGTINSAGIGRTTKLKKIDTLGNVIWNWALAPKSAEYVDDLRIAFTNNGEIYFYGYARLWYSFPPTLDSYFCFLQKQDTSGNVMWTKDWIINDFFATPFSGFTMSNACNLLLNYTSSTGSWVYTISPAGVITDSMLIAEPNIEGFAELSGFAVTGFRNDSLVGFDTAGMLVHIITFSTPVQGINSMNDTLYVLTHDSIFSFTGNLQPIHASAVPGYSSYSTLKVGGQDIRFLSHGSNALTVITLNRQLQVTGTLTIPEAIDQDAYIDFNDLQLSAGITFNLAEFSAVRFLNYSMNSTQSVSLNRTDIGVINLMPTMVSAIPYGQPASSYTSRLEADVLIKNYGPDTLNSCRITRYNGLSVMINPTVFAQEFKNLNLAPGDSMWLSLGAIFQGMSFPSGNEIKKTICIHTNHPNGLVDLNVANDEFCREILFGYVSIEEAEREHTFLIYPNPASSILNFDIKESSEKINTIELYDIQGRQVAIVHPHHFTATFDISHLPNGIYIARVATTDRLLTRRVVKSN